MKQFRSLSRPADALAEIRARLWAAVGPPYSQLIVVADGVEWSITWDMRELSAIARKLGLRVCATRRSVGFARQAIFYGSQFVLLDPRQLARTNRNAVAYFHGKPWSDEPELSACFKALRRHHERLHRVQVSNTTMRDLVLETGIDPTKVFVIPIGINLAYFDRQSAESRRRAREAYGLSQSAVIVGSFQKDGVGWGEGLKPKRIKGPDVFLETIEALKPRIPELFVLLSGPSRGYVKAGLERLRVPFRHFNLERYPDVGRLFHALDLYLVTSRDDGGPKAILESMASGVPLVTTRVGQAVDLVRHGGNAWMVDVEDVQGLGHWAEYALAHRHSSEVERVLHRGQETAEANSYERQLPLWDRFTRGFVGEGTAGRD